jgi:hypothetical protein
MPGLISLAIKLPGYERPENHLFVYLGRWGEGV